MPADPADDRPDDSGLVRHLRRIVKDANRDAAEQRRRADELRGPAVRGLIVDLGVADPKHVAALAKLHEGAADREAVAKTVAAWSEVFGAGEVGAVDDTYS